LVRLMESTRKAVSLSPAEAVYCLNIDLFKV
jgi:hypothetical protein